MEKKIDLGCHDEAACSALTKGAARDNVALVLAFALRDVAGEYDIALWVEGVRTQLNKADLPTRAQEISLEREPQAGIASLNELYCFRDSPQMLQGAE